MMGGSSSINSMSYIRGHRADYNGWEKLGNKGWSYDEVLPYFKRSEKNLNREALDRKYHGVDGEQPVSRFPYIDSPSFMMTKAFNERGLPLIDYNAAHQEGSMQAQAFSKCGKRVSANSAFIIPIKSKRKNLTIRTKSEVFEIIIEGNRATGVKYVREGVNYTVYAKKEVIVCGGTVNTPKLLMLSGVGPRKHLESLGIPCKKNLAVGENLQDHVTFNGIVIELPKKTYTLVDQDEIREEVIEYKNMTIKYGPISGNGPVNSIAFLKTKPDLIAPDIQYQVAHATYWREYMKEPLLYESVSFFPTAFYDGVIPRTMNVVPKSKGWLLLNSTNPHGKPLIYANYLDKKEDFEPLLRGVKFLLTLEDTEAFKCKGARFVREPLPACIDYEWGSDKYFICLAVNYTSSTYHAVGTCKMGPKSDKKAVVDPKLRLYGIPNIRIPDASIMPVIIRGNTNAPTMMIAEKGAQFIIDQWSRKPK